MNKIIPAAAAIAIAFSLPLAAEAQNHGQGKGREHAQEHGGDHDDDDRSVRGRRGDDAGEARGRGPERAGRDVRRGAPDVRELARGPDPRGPGRVRDRDDDRDDDDRVRPRGERGRSPVALVDGSDDLDRAVPGRGLIAGCPPGLAKRNNGCLPPGQERKIAAGGYDWLWNRGREANWRYDDGYLYRLDRSGSVAGWLPALGGALAPGAVWPRQYGYQPVAPYQADYFRLQDPYDYRYADGALFGVDPRTQAITQVVALLTGQPITVGQPMPAGYDVYNVPYAYRNQYADSAESIYRYNDGYVYRVDPTTQLVQAAIQLLT